MDEDEFIELKYDTYLVFKEEVQDTIELHEVILEEAQGGSSINTRFGYVDEADTPNKTTVPKTKVYTLFFSNIWRARFKKVPTGEGEYVADHATTLYISTLELEQKGISIKRDRSFLRFKDGTEVQMESVQPLPRMYGSSIVHKIRCSIRKPHEDNPGIN